MTTAPQVNRFWPGPPAALLAVPLLLLAFGAGWAATRPRVENPHGRFREECGLCHGPSAWRPAQVSPKFDHAKFGFPLTGAHAVTACLGCHQSLDFSASPSQCVSCHQDPHRGEVGTECARCHSARSFVDRAPMVHAHQLTRFPLTGSHVALDCESCHKPSAQGQMQFVNTRAECGDCHMNEFRAAKAPDHVAGGFPTDCRSCHGATTWSSARFDHSSTSFPLVGAHRTVRCESCHAGNRFRGTARECAACHIADYDRAQPPHAAAGFAASACASCHNPGGWANATFDHDTRYFRIYAGGHAGRWTACSDCHSTPATFTSFSCLGCHPHADQTTTDSNHAGRSGYRYDSLACYSCHPR